MLLAVSLAAAPAVAQTFATRELRVTGSPQFETTPTLGEDRTSRVVVFTSRDFAISPTPYGQVYYQRVDQTGLIGLPELVSFVPGTDDQLNDISGDNIVFSAYVSPTSNLGEVRVYEISSGAQSVVSELTTLWEARIHGRRVAWVDGNAGTTRVLLKDLRGLASGERPIVLAGPTPPASDVEIGDTLVVWMTRRGTQLDVTAYDARTDTVFDVAADPSINERSASTWGSWVTWQASAIPTAGVRVEAHNVDTGEHRIVADNGAFNLAPTIHGDFITYESNVSGNYDIYLYRLSTGQTFRVTDHPADQRLNNVYGDMVAYVDSRDGNSDVFLSTFEFVNEPPAVTCPADVVASAGPGQPGAVVDYPAPVVSDDAPGATAACVPPSGSTFPLGATTVACTATDVAGLTAACSFIVTVTGAEEQLGDLQGTVSGLGLPQGMTTALNTKLQAALDAYAAGDIATACASLNAFLNEVNAQAGKKLTVTQAAMLRAEAERIRGVIGCP